MKLTAGLNWMGNTCKLFVTRSVKTAFWLFVGASVGLCLGIGAGTAAAQTSVSPDVGRLKLDFIYPNLSTDQDLGTYAFPSAGSSVNVSFGAGVVFAGSRCNSNCFGIDISPTGFDVSTQPGPGGIAFINGDQAIVKVTTLDTSLINVVSLQTNGLGLSPGALLFGDNFFQVNLAASSLPLPEGNNSSFTVDYSGGLGAPGPAPVPAPASLPLVASGLAALALARLATRMGVSNRSGRVETA